MEKLKTYLLDVILGYKLNIVFLQDLDERLHRVFDEGFVAGAVIDVSFKIFCQLLSGL